MGTITTDVEIVKEYIVNVVTTTDGITDKALRLRISGVFPNLNMDLVYGLLCDMASKDQIKEIEYISREVRYFYIPPSARIRKP